MTKLTLFESPRSIVSLREAMDQLLEDSFVGLGTGLLREAGSLLAVDVYETDEALIVNTPVPGMKPEDIEISVTGDVLTIRGETREELEEGKGRYHRHEVRYGQLSRTVQLPAAVQVDKTDAVCQDGVLKITLPKAPESKAQTISVKAHEPNGKKVASK